MSSRLVGLRADRPMSYSAIEVYSSSLRRSLRYDDLDPFPAATFFEDELGELTVPYNGSELALREALERCDSEGLTRWDPDSKRIYVGLSEQSYEMLQNGHVRASYTLAHELGHALIHTDQLVRLASLSKKSQAALHRDNRGDHPAYLDTEWQANAFASALLMPAAGLKRIEKNVEALTANMVSKRYNVSHQAAVYRLASYKKV
jgi:IrrE N-terminal-like domain